ncbi:MAG: tetratricopeptide repeat protein [Flavobacteriaceae bacterium]|nr:tetratricopeptide repeat protein [Flavobacteriaceae bacterium]
MKLSFEENIDQGKLFQQENLYEKSIESYENAFLSATTTVQQIGICNTLGKLHQKIKLSEKAIAFFNQSLALHKQSSDVQNLGEQATIYNNLATIYLISNIQLAIENYQIALSIYTKLAENEQTAFYPHLANTHFALGEAFQQKEDLYAAKTQFKSAVKFYEQLPESKLNELKAMAHYHLGNLYTEEFNLYDAMTNYSKALDIFQNLETANALKTKPYSAAVLNNLGVTYKSMGETEKAFDHYEQALQAYLYLARHDHATFAPYVAATLNSLSILYAEEKNFEKAIDYSHKTVEVYNDLSDEFPESYTHYLATSLHNLGLFYFELKAIDSAEKYFKQALQIRMKLAVEQPDAFDADVCATALNLVELYQAELENKMDLHYKALGLELLNDVNRRLQRYPENRPVLMSMKSDCQYYSDYFNRISLPQLQLENTYKKIHELTEDIHSTIHPKEKIVFQNLIVALLEEQSEHLPQHEKLKTSLADELNSLAWLYLQLNQPKEAEITLMKAQSLGKNLPAMQCNLAHSYLLQNKLTEAKNIYTSLFDQRSTENESYVAIILRDLDKLKNGGVYHADFRQIKELFAVKER